MNNPPRTLPLLQITRADTADPDSIDYAERDKFGEILEPCILSPVGQCQYSIDDGYESCIHCKKGAGVL